MRAFLLFKSKVLARTLAKCENCSATIGPWRIVVRAFCITAFFVLVLYHIFYHLSNIFFVNGSSMAPTPTKVSLYSERTVEDACPYNTNIVFSLWCNNRRAKITLSSTVGTGVLDCPFNKQRTIVRFFFWA